MQAIAISMVPTISHAAAHHDTEEVHESIGTGYRLTTLIAFPCMIGLMVLSGPILTLLYPERVDEAMTAVPTFMIMCVSIVTLAMYETTTGTLQAVGKQVIPVRNVAIGAVAKIATTYVLVGIRGINIRGAAISSVIAYLTAFILNERAVVKYTSVKISIFQTYIKPFIAAAVMGACAYLSYIGLRGFLGSNLAVCIAILVGVISYAAMVILIKVVTPQDLEMIPKGDKINKAISKFVKWE